MRRFFVPVLVVVAAMLAYSPFMIAGADYESSMGIISKILYFHAPSGMVMLLSAMVCGVASAIYLWRKSPGADRLAIASAELTAPLVVLVIVTGPVWAPNAWGAWWG